jgi:hypothetical protein
MINGLAPSTFGLTVSGLQNGDDCTNCTLGNGNFTLTINTYAATFCTWRYRDPQERFDFTLTIGSSPPYFAELILRMYSAPGCDMDAHNTAWYHDQDTPYDGLNLSNFSLPFDEDWADFGGCIGSGSSASISSP